MEARDICKNRTGRLAVLPKRQDAESLVAEIKAISTPFSEEDFFKNIRHEFGMDRRYWIGLSDIIKEGSWEWVQDGGNDKVKLDYYNFWYPQVRNTIYCEYLFYVRQLTFVRKQQPDIPGEHCVTLWNPAYQLGESHTFNDENCGNKHYFICEETGDHSTPEGVSTKITGRSLSKNQMIKRTIPNPPTFNPVETTKVKRIPKPQATTNVRELKKRNKASGEDPAPIPIPTGKTYFQKKKSHPASLHPGVPDPTPVIPPPKKRHNKLFVAQKRAAEAGDDTLEPNKDVEMDYENELIEMTNKDPEAASINEEKGIGMGDLLKGIKDLSPSDRMELLEYLKEKMVTTPSPFPSPYNPKEKSQIVSIGLKELLSMRRKLKNKGQTES